MDGDRQPLHLVHLVRSSVEQRAPHTLPRRPLTTPCTFSHLRMLLCEQTLLLFAFDHEERRWVKQAEALLRLARSLELVGENAPAATRATGFCMTRVHSFVNSGTVTVRYVAGCSDPLACHFSMLARKMQPSLCHIIPCNGSVIAL